MKCKICGHQCKGENALQNMNAHYRKAHPNRPKKARAKKGTPVIVSSIPVEHKFCPTCGKPL